MLSISLKKLTEGYLCNHQSHSLSNTLRRLNPMMSLLLPGLLKLLKMTTIVNILKNDETREEADGHINSAVCLRKVALKP